MNQVQVTGRLTRDPELKQLPGDTSVCELRLAVDGMQRGRETGYIDVATFGKPGQAAAKVLGKGWLVAVEGRLQQQTWTTDDGTRRERYALVGHVEFLAAPRALDSTDSGAGDAEPDDFPLDDYVPQMTAVGEAYA